MNQELPSTAIQESYWVIPNRFRAGEYPGSIDDDEARRKIRWLISQGINLFIDLTQAGEYGLKPYDAILKAEAIKRNADVSYERISLRDFGRPINDTMAEILDKIDSALAKGENIYLHCFFGRGRTGTVVGCYLVRHGTTGEGALKKIQELRNGIPGKHERSPETEEQRKMVAEWIK